MSTLHNDGLCMSAWLLCVHPDNVSHPAIALDYLQEYGMDRKYALAVLRACAAEWCKDAFPKDAQDTMYYNTPCSIVEMLRDGTFNPDTPTLVSQCSFNQMFLGVKGSSYTHTKCWLPFCVRVEQAYGILCELEKYA